MVWLTGVEARLAEALAAMERFTGKVDAILPAFEPDGAAAVEDLKARLEVARGWLEGFVRRVAEDGVAPDTSDLAWSDYLSSAWPIAERVVADLNL